jgi:hypothetical protein
LWLRLGQHAQIGPSRGLTSSPAADYPAPLIHYAN